MGFKPLEMMAGVFIYAVLVLPPTVPVMMAYFEVYQPFLARLTVGFISILAGKLMWEGFRGEVSGAVARRYVGGVTWVPLVAGIVVWTVAWFTDIATVMAGTVESRIIFGDGEGLELGTVMARVITGILSFAGARLVAYGLTTTDTPDMRRTARVARAQDRRSKAEAYLYEE